LEEKFALAAKKSHVNYSFFFGATNDNISLFPQLDPHRIPGIKLFMGSSTGNMLVDRREALEQLFSSAKLPIMAHCEDTAIINRNMAEAKEKYGEDPKVIHHPEIRSEEACYESTRLAVKLAQKYNARLHIAHLSTARELDLLPTSHFSYLSPLTIPEQSSPTRSLSHLSLITAEATVSHLYFSDRDYASLGTRIKCNPAIKSERDREALQLALTDGRITVIGTDHAPHLLSQKEGGCAKAVSGMPMIQFSLVTMLELVDNGVLSLERLVELMCHNPARLFEVRHRGFIREGYQADLVLVRPNTAWVCTKDLVESKCGWSPMEGHMFLWRVERTLCNGHTVYADGKVDTSYIGQPVTFR
jgi:dihydroorotase